MHDCEVTDSVQYEQAVVSVKHYLNMFVDYLFIFFFFSAESKAKAGARMCASKGVRIGILIKNSRSVLDSTPLYTSAGFTFSSE